MSDTSPGPGPPIVPPVANKQKPRPGDGSFLTNQPGSTRPGDGSFLVNDSSARNGDRSARGRGRGRGRGVNGHRPNGDRPLPNGVGPAQAEITAHATRGRHPGRPKADAAKRAEASRATPLDPQASSFVPPSTQLANLSVQDSIHTSRSSSAGPSDHSGKRINGRRGRGGNPPNGRARPAVRADGDVSPVHVSGRRAAFQNQTKLTMTTSRSSDQAEQEHGVGSVKKDKPKRERKREPVKDNLVSRLTRGLGKRPFVECPICFNSIIPSQPIWSCLPPTAPAPPDAPPNYAQSCYTPFHLSCIRDWANRSLEEVEKAIASGKEGETPEWRCPGCQKRRPDRVGGYKCFCGKVVNPPTNSVAPHSCGEGCSRKRTGCDHACTLPCHPGPCPPCQVALIVPCPSHHTSITVKCAAATGNNAAMSPVCDETCGRPRSCGNKDHTCELLCHFGDCAPCSELEGVRCYCGEDAQEVVCGWNRDKEKECTGLPEDGIEEHWRGRYSCKRIYDKLFDCGIHRCEEPCHPHPICAPPCPTSPSMITTCPCGTTLLSSLPGYPRADCMAPIPTCDSPCPKSRPCGHQCPRKCHSGDCPPCHEEVTRPCRCGESVLTVPCDVMRKRAEMGEGELRCERVCGALRNCGRHQCNRVCCPLSWQRGAKGKKKHDEQIITGDDDLHTCPLTCGKLLSCGLHTCPRPDHKGACGRCLQASYDELICHCGNTVVYPPVACGTTISCLFPCARDPPSCGHPKTPHTCHESPNCPPCPYLTPKPCACGKEPSIKNIRCSQTVVSCGQKCGTLLSCGYHTCDKICHTPGECPPCTQVCNKPKRICKHPCTSVCHAPARCPENNPCQAIITQSCACGNLSSRTSCGASNTNPSSKEVVVIPCNSECKVKQRNARLADALGIKTEGRGEADWSTELKAFGNANHAFVKTVENTLREFFASARQTTVLPHMPLAKRTFVMQLADVYHLAKELVDQEPNRSVMIRRRVDTRIPHPLLSAVTAPPASKPALGGLANLRATNAWGNSNSTSASRSGTANGLFSSATMNGSRSGGGGWSSAVATPAGTTPTGSRPVTPLPTEARRGKVGEVGVVDEPDWENSGDEA